MRLNRLDLNQLVCLDALLEERSVTRAAKRVLIGQSAMSLALGRLRDYFEDDIVVQIGRNMVLTPFAEELVKPVRDIMLQIRDVTEKKPEFDAAKSDRTINVLASDYLVEILVLELFRRARAAAPHMTFVLHDFGKDFLGSIDRGEIDLLVIPDLFSSKDHPSEFLFEETFSCVVWDGNAQVGERLSLRQYLDMEHVTTVRDDAGLTIADRMIKKSGHSRVSRLTVPNISLVPNFIVGTGMVATLQTRFAKRMTRHLPLRVLPCPLAIPPMAEVVQRQKRVVRDPAVVWFNNLLKDVAAELENA